ncbi:hypothetical protein ACS0TY_014868 [Phlomoides rotata]
MSRGLRHTGGEPATLGIWGSLSPISWILGLMSQFLSTRTPLLTREYDKDAHFQNLTTPPNFLGDPKGRLDEEWWLPGMSAAVKQLLQANLSPEDLTPMDPPLCRLSLTKVAPEPTEPPIIGEEEGGFSEHGEQETARSLS